MKHWKNEIFTEIWPFLRFFYMISFFDFAFFEILFIGRINVTNKLFNSLMKNFKKFNDNVIIWMSTQPILQKIQKYLQRIHNLFITNKLSLLLEALSNCDNFTVITILCNNDVLTWDYKNNNKYQVTMS